METNLSADSKTKRVLRRRKLNRNASYRALEKRLMALPDKIINVCHDKWLTAYCVFDTYPDCEMQNEIDVRYGTDVDNPLMRLYRVCIARNIQPRGITSERIRGGKRLASLPEDELRETLFVGAHCSFNGRKRSVFALAPEDKRYYDCEHKDQFGRDRVFL